MNRIIFAAFFLLSWIAEPVEVFAQKNDATHDVDAGNALKISADKYKKMGGFQSDFTLITVRPKLKAEEPESKYTETQNGKVWVKGNAFKVQLGGNEIVCNGKDIWTYIAKSKECQLNEFIESDEVFSPSQIFNLYDKNFAYQMKEDKVANGIHTTVIELAPSNKKALYFKIDVSLNDSKEITEVKVYEKNGMRYFYRPQNTVANAGLTDSFFSFDTKKYPNVHVEDLR
ncbi:MAG TPA: outer membrane lipoprotein carrier protein LolA [Chitinophagales bacterium]